jgi:hypothetical protein
MIFPLRRWGKEKSSTFAAEIHSRNGLILFHGILVVAPSRGILGGAFFMLPAQLDDIDSATRFHLPEIQFVHRIFFPYLPFTIKIQKI